MMLGYLTFCCFILAQVKGQCRTKEFSTIVKNLRTNSKCSSGDTANLRFLPTGWPPCKWPCLQKGFEDMNDIRNQSDPSCARRITSINGRIAVMIKKCPNITSNATCGNATVGSMTDFLQEVQNYLSSLERNNPSNQC